MKLSNEERQRRSEYMKVLKTEQLIKEATEL